MLRKLRRSIASFAVVAIIASLSVASAVSAFSDVKESDWYFSNVQDLVDAGVLDGTKDMFHPADNLNRAEAAKIAVLAAGVAEEDLVNPETPSFSDVPKSLWAYKYIETAKSLGYVSGDAGKKTFRPGDNVNRAEYAKMMSLALELEENLVGGPHFSDVSSSAWYYNVVETAYNWSVVSGYEGGIYKPSAAINRAEMSKMTVAAMDPTEREVVVTPAPGVDCTKTPTAAGCTAPAPVLGGKLTLSLAANNPAGTSIIAGQAIADLAHFTFANGDSKDAKVTNLKLKRLGVSADTTLTKVYLYNGNTRLSDEATVSAGVITFNNPTGVFTVPASGSLTVMVKANIKDTSGTSPVGQLVGVGLTSAADVVTTGTVDGNFPLNGNTFTVASADLATVSFQASASTTPSTNTALDPQLEYTVWQNTVSVGNRAVNLNAVTFRNIGSVAATDLTNFKLYVDGVQVGTTVAQADATGYVTFDMSAAAKKLETGSRLFRVQADVIGGSSKDFTISLRQAADVNVFDSQYNVPVLVQTAASTFAAVEAGKQTISSGTLTITKSTTSPSGTVVKGGTNITLAKYDLKAFGEAMKVESLRIQVDTTGPADGTTTASQIGKLRNGSLYVDGVQVGSTADIYGVSGTAAYTEYTLGSAVVVTPGKVSVLEIKSDIYDNDGTDNVIAGTTINPKIAAGSSNLQRMVSGGYTANGAVTDASTLTVASGSMSASKDQSYGAQTVVVPVTAKLLGKFTLVGGNTEDINLNTIKAAFTFGNSDFASVDLTNVYLKYGTKTSSIKSTITSAAATETSSNTWSISELLAKNTSMTFEVYGDIASTAVSTADAEDKVTTLFEATGTTVSSGTTVYSGAAGADATVTGQVVTATTSGNLTVTLDNGTPVSSIVVAGSASTDGLLKIKLTGTNEDLYVKDLTFRADTLADSAVISSVSLWKAEGSGAYVQVLTDKVWSADGTVNPGYTKWTLTGTDRIKVPKNGSSYLLVKPTYVGSADATITGQTPRIALTDLQAEGTSVMSASGTGATLINASGIIVQANSSATYVTSGATHTAATITAVQTTVITTNGALFAPGDVIFIDGNADSTWDPSSEELMTVSGVDTNTLNVLRGAFGTTAYAYDVDTDPIYRLSGAIGTYANATVMSNAATVLKSKLSLAMAGDTPQGATTGGTQRVIYKFNASAANNAADPAENKVVLTSVALTTTKSGLTVQNVAVYPSEFDQNATYKTTCTALSSTKWGCTLDTDGAANEIVENTTRSYVVRADVGSGSGTSNTLDVSIASLGSASAAGVVTDGDVVWTDGTTSKSWVNQAGASYVQAASPMTLGASSGTTDATAPTISSVTITDAGSTGDDVLTTGTVVVTFSERMDPTTIGSFTPGAAAAAVTDTATGDVIVKNAAGASSYDLLRIVGIVDVTLGATTFVTGDVTVTDTAALSSNGTVLTLILSTITGAGNDGTEAIEANSAATTMKDANSVAATAGGSNSATVTSLDI